MKPAAPFGGQAQKMNEVLEKGWRLSYAIRPEEIHSVAMPEPQHRIGPAGVSSGLSVRELPKARLEDLTDICQHFEQKCSGMYSSDSAAARYLFQLSREVQQVAATLMKEKSARSLAAEKAEKFLEEWKESFGVDTPLIQDACSLELPLAYGGGVKAAGEAGSEGEEEKDAVLKASKYKGVSEGGNTKDISPSMVAEALRRLARRAADARKETTEAKHERVSSEAGLRGVLDAHVTASAESSEADRLMHREDRSAMAEEHNKMVETLREQHEQAIQQILVEKDVEHSKSCEAFKKQLNEVQLELLNNRQHTINTEAQWRKRVEDLEQRERTEVSRMREHFQEQLSRAKSEAAAVQAVALGVSNVSEGRRRNGGGTRGVLGSSSGTTGPNGASDGDGDGHKVRSLTLMLEESRKECKWARERNQELERVVEALRKTIMRQAEISSQRPEQQGRQHPTNMHRVSRQSNQDHPQHHPGGTGYGMGGLRGSRVGRDHAAYHDPGSLGLNSRSGGGHPHHVPGTSARDDEHLLLRSRVGGVHGGAGTGAASRGHEEAYMNRYHHPHQFTGGSRGGVGPGGGGGTRSGGPSSPAVSASAAAGGMTRGGIGGRSHPLQMQQQLLRAEAPPPPSSFRRYASHDAYDDGFGIMVSSSAGGQLRQQHSTGRLLMRPPVGSVEKGGGGGGGTHAGNVPGSVYDRDLPDRGWSQSAPLPGNNISSNGHNGGTGGGGRSAVAHGVIGSRGGGAGGTEYAAPVPKHHHRQHDGGQGHSSAAVAGGGNGGGGGGGGGSSRWDRDPPRDTMAFASSKYPPGCFPSGGVYGEGAIFEQVPLPLEKRGEAYKGSGPGGGGGAGVAGLMRGNGDFQVYHQQQHQQKQKQLAYPRRQGMLPGSSPEGVARGGVRSGEPSPIAGPVNSGSSAFELSSQHGGRTGGRTTTTLSQAVRAGVRQERHEGGGSSSRGGKGGVGGTSAVDRTETDSGETRDFDFGEIDTAAVLGL